jgi:hypothetical protein
VSDAGIVDHDVGDAVLRTHLLGEPFDGVGVRDIEGVRMRDATARGDLGGGVFDTGLVDVADHDLGPQPGELQRRGAADAAARARDGNQCVTEVFARTPDLGAQQSPARRLPAEEVDEFTDRLSQHLRVGERRPVSGVHVASPQPCNPVAGVVIHTRQHELVLGVHDDLHRHVNEMVGSRSGDRAEVVGAVDLQAVGGIGLEGLCVMQLCRGDAVAHLQQADQTVGEECSYDQRRQHGYGKPGHIGEVQHLAGRTHKAPRAVWALEITQDVPVQVVAARSGHRGERRDAIARARS